MDVDKLPLGVFEVDCDGSACGSGDVINHIHPPHNGHQASAMVVVRDHRRVSYGPAMGVTRLLLLGEVD
jgi:hypothetical protein